MNAATSPDHAQALARAARQADVVRALGGTLFLAGALIMCYNLWKTVTSVDRKSTAPSAVPAE